MDAQGSKITRARSSDFKVANNNFRIIKDLSLRFWGRRNSPPFFVPIYFNENLRKKSIILKPKGLIFWGFFLSEI